MPRTDSGFPFIGLFCTKNNGSKKYEKAVGPRISDALEEKIKREAKAKKGIYAILQKQEHTTFDELFELYERDGKGKEYVLSKKQTYLDYFGGWKLSQVTRKDLFDFRDMLKTTPKLVGGGMVTETHVNRVMAGLRRLFNYATIQDIMERSPFPTAPKSGLFYPEPKGLRNFFTEEQMEHIINTSPDWLRPMVLTAYYTGVREGELLNFLWKHVDLQAGIIYLPSSKTLKDASGKGQKIVMQRDLIDLFKVLPTRSEWVFCKPDGRPYRHWNIFEAFRRVLKSVGIDTEKYSWKEIRHTTGSIMNLKGGDPMAIKDQLRHTDFKTTQNFYIGSDVEHQRAQNEKLTLNSGKTVGKRDQRENKDSPSP